MVFQIAARSCSVNLSRNCTRSPGFEIIARQPFHSTVNARQQQQQHKQKPLFGKHQRMHIYHEKRNLERIIGRLADSWNNTETKWYPIPVALGLGVIGFIQYRRVRQREDAKAEKPRYVASGPWQVR